MMDPDPKKQANKLTNVELVMTSLCAGAVAGALAKSSIAPLDRAKINFQVKTEQYSAKKAWEFLMKTYTDEGFAALWRGNSATMARIIPYAAIQFTAHEQWKRLLGVDQNIQQPGRLLLAGSMAGITSQSLTYPLDFARARMAVTQKHEYSGLKQVFVKIYYEEGALTFFRGYVATILGVIPYAGVSFFTYDTLKRLYREHVDPAKKLNPMASLAFGAAAGMLGQTSSYPLDIVRRRMQTDTEKKYTSIINTLRHIYRQEGVIRGFYKGLSMNWIKGPIAVGISFATYDHIKDSLRNLLTKVEH